MRTRWFQKLHAIPLTVIVAVGLWIAGQAVATDFEPPVQALSSGGGTTQFGSVVVTTPDLWGPGIDAKAVVEPQITTRLIVN